MLDAARGAERILADVEQYFGLCRFSNCRHESEPGCAVREANRLRRAAERALSKLSKLLRESEYAGDSASYLKQKQQRFLEIAKKSRALQKAGGKRGMPERSE